MESEASREILYQLKLISSFRENISKYIFLYSYSNAKISTLKYN